VQVPVLFAEQVLDFQMWQLLKVLSFERDLQVVQQPR
jgi:hypothetical protein